MFNETSVKAEIEKFVTSGNRTKRQIKELVTTVFGPFGAEDTKKISAWIEQVLLECHECVSDSE